MSNHRISKIPKFILNFSLTENEHEISAMLDLPTSPTSPMDVMDLNPFRYFTGLVPKVSKSVQKVSQSVYIMCCIIFSLQLFGQRWNIASS